MHALIVVVVLFVIWFSILTQHTQIVHSLLSGFWSADKGFCEESGLDLMFFNIDNGKPRKCYVFAGTKDGVVINDLVTMHVSLQWGKRCNWSTSVNGVKYINVTFKGLNPSYGDEFPEIQEGCFYPLCNKLVLYSGDRTTAVLYKDPMYSELCLKSV